MINKYYKVEVTEWSYNLANGFVISKKLYDVQMFNNYSKAINYCDEIVNKKNTSGNIVTIKIPKIIKLGELIAENVTPGMYSPEYILGQLR